MTREVFQAADLTSSACLSTPASAPSLALVPVSGVPPKVQTSSKAALALKEIPKEPIAISESTESSSKEDTRIALLDVPPIQAMGAITIKGRVVKHARTSEPVGAAPSPPIDKEKKVVEHLSSILKNELLNITEVTVESTLASMARMLCERMFGGF